jgi:lipoprotein-anchoring transpeptidase ErfK/SrfK
MARRIWLGRSGTGLVIAAVLSVSMVAGCTATPTSGQFRPIEATSNPTPSTAPPSPKYAGPSALALAPVAGTSAISPADGVSATLTAGTLTNVTLVAADGRAVAGTLHTDKTGTSWHNSDQLAYNKAYTLTVVGDGADGKHYQETSTFTTVKPRSQTLPSLIANPAQSLDGGTFGVGQPVVIRFDEHIKDKAAAQRTLSVTTSPPGLLGSWYWMDDMEVHWRPEFYWPAGTKVIVRADVYGHDLGGGLYGQANRSATFTIGPEKIAVADAVTHRMKVYISGQQVTTINGLDVTAGIPISMGKGGSEREPNGTVVDFTTNSGPHVVMMKYEVYRMTSASFGITDPHSRNFYDTPIKKSIRISGDGEFVHLRDWDVSQIGNINTSHGCINVGVDYIYWFYDQFGAGDIVNVTGTSRNLSLRNGLGDWTLDWATWQQGSALQG